jgi:uncharacterized lipoprotein YmbA
MLLSSNQVFLHPWPRSAPLEYQVAVEVMRFDGNLGGDVVLSAIWTVFSKDRKEVLLRKRQAYTQPVKGDRYDALVIAHGQSLEALSRDIAAAVKEIAGGKS